MSLTDHQRFLRNQIRAVKERNAEIEKVQCEIDCCIEERRETAETIKEKQELLHHITKRQKELEKRAAFLGDVQPTTRLEAELMEALNNA